MNYKQEVKKILQQAGIELNGSNPWDIQIHNEKVYKRFFSGTIEIGESYMDGWWDVDRLEEFIFRIAKIDTDEKLRNINMLPFVILAKILNLQTKTKSKKVGEQHYDVGNELYKKMLDKRMVYSCGYWKDANNLDEAQENKLDLICKKIGLKAGDRILDIGCGWGSFAKFAAERYGVKVVGLTISKEQKKLADERCRGLDVEIRLQDYRDMDGTEKFDHIVSIGMFEHVGYKNYRLFMEKVSELLKEDGLFLLHSIGNKKSATFGDPWSDEYIFPGGSLPSLAQIGKSFDGLFIPEDVHNFGYDYYLTLMAWAENFDKSWEELKKSGK